MKKLIQVALLAGALTACSSEPAEEAAEAPATEETAASDLPGTYEVTQADGTKTTTVINADGTYTDTGADGTEVSGTWAEVDGKECFTPAADAEGEAAATCYTSTEPGEDGTFTATPDEGDPLTVKKTA